MADEGEVQATAEELQEARELGWADKDQWKGNPEHWVDARTFLERGRHVLPIVVENNKRLKGELSTLNSRLESVNTALRSAQATIDALEESRTADLLEAAEAARAKLKSELAEASREGRHEDVADLTVKLTELGQAEEDPKKKKGAEDEEQARRQADEVSPAFRAWAAENPDFVADRRKLALANVISQELRDSGNKLVGKEFMDLVADKVDEVFGARGGRTTKAESGGGGGRNGPNGGGGSGKTYADLPADAKAACDRAAKRVVGEGRAHKTIDSWRKVYTEKYYAQEQ